MLTPRIALFLCLASLSTGCVARVTPAPAYVEATYVPDDIEYYPHTVYDGRVVYLVDDRWYYREGPRWVYFRDEPAPLYRQRAYAYRQYPYYYRQRPYVQQAPRANRYYYPRQAPPYRQGPPPRREPPPGLREAPPAIPSR